MFSDVVGIRKGKEGKGSVRISLPLGYERYPTKNTDRRLYFLSLSRACLSGSDHTHFIGLNTEGPHRGKSLTANPKVGGNEPLAFL